MPNPSTLPIRVHAPEVGTTSAPEVSISTHRPVRSGRPASSGSGAPGAGSSRPSLRRLASSSSSFSSFTLSPPLPNGSGSVTPDYYARGRSHSPRPPSYARSSLDRSPSMNPMVLDDRPRVPPPLYLRSSSPQGVSSKGNLKIHIPAWGIVIVRPPRQLELHPMDSENREPPQDDTVLSGALEVVMKERRRCQAISVGVQSVCKLHMGAKRGWEEDGVFERGVEVLGGDSEGIWLEKGSQTFTFSLLLPATLATTDHHQFGRLSYILTARVEGIPASGITAFFKHTSSSPSAIASDIPFKEDFDAVIARSDKLAHDLALSRSHSRDSLSTAIGGLGLSTSPPELDDSAIAIGEGSPTLTGLYTRRQSSDIQHPPNLSLSPSHGSSPLSGDAIADDRRSIMSSGSNYDAAHRSEKTGWMKGDLLASRSLIVHANPSPTGGVNQLDLRKEGFVDGLGSWRFAASADVFSISSVVLLSVAFPSPSPKTTIFFLRLLLTQGYTLISPRTPNNKPHMPEAAKNHVVYQVGRQHRHGERCPERDVDSLWRGTEAGGKGCDEGWKTRAMMRMPNHDKVRATTQGGTITPIRVTHEFQLQVFYSVDGESVAGRPIKGPGELRMMAVKMPITLPSCCCVASTLTLPTYEQCENAPKDIDAILASPPTKQHCMCGSTFSELGEAAMKRMQLAEQEELEERVRAQAGEPAPANGVKDAEASNGHRGSGGES